MESESGVILLLICWIAVFFSGIHCGMAAPICSALLVIIFFHASNLANALRAEAQKDR